MLCILNMMRYFSSIRVLLSILRDSDPLLYQSVDGNGFFTTHGQLNKQLRLVRYINTKQYLEHYDPDVIFRCERIRKQFMLISRLSILVVVSLVYMVIAN
ncbi:MULTISPECIES: universal stress protein UspB [unclassified Providencia]|uniref:universal stress protein UspB n=1 Tax=unclassified Providencia TaxID=2633465 RepID=UPI00234B3043|nr:universal stress protein UspB [Providencia sp. PROV212]